MTLVDTLATLVILTAPQPYTRWVEHSHAPTPPEVNITLDGNRVCGFENCVTFDAHLHLTRNVERTIFFHELGHSYGLQTDPDQTGVLQDFTALDHAKTYDTYEAERFADAYRLCSVVTKPTVRNMRRVFAYFDYNRWGEVRVTKARAACRLIRG